MKLELFKAGHWRQRYQYKSFEPTKINDEWTWNDSVVSALLERAAKSLGELNAFSLIVPDVDLFIQMHVAKEAQTSSRIEGTQTGMDEVLMPEENIQLEKRNDWREVHNYIEAINAATITLDKLPLSNRLIKETHSLLMQGVRGENKAPGEFRISQNWVGGSNLTDAAFIPPHPDSVMDLMADLENFLHNDNIFTPHLIRAAISHYQFETIHPFLDGNGRIGRLLITLYLLNNGLLEKPSLYLSDFFERNRASYYDALTKVRESNDLLHWIKFFLRGIEETATKGRRVFSEILKLRASAEEKVFKMGKRSGSAKILLDKLFVHPIIKVSEVETMLSMSTPSSNALIKEFCGADILKEMTGRTRKRIFVFDKYLNLFIK